MRITQLAIGNKSVVKHKLSDLNPHAAGQTCETVQIPIPLTVKPRSGQNRQFLRIGDRPFRAGCKIRLVVPGEDAVHREGLGRLVELVGRRDPRLLDDAGQDPIAGILLSLYDLAPFRSFVPLERLQASAAPESPPLAPGPEPIGSGPSPWDPAILSMSLQRGAPAAT